MREGRERETKKKNRESEKKRENKDNPTRLMNQQVSLETGNRCGRCETGERDTPVISDHKFTCRRCAGGWEDRCDVENKVIQEQV